MSFEPETASRLLQRRLVLARRAALARTLAESACLAVSAGCLALAAIEFAGATTAQPALAALPAALSAAGAWWLERRKAASGVVRRVDRGLGLEGGLVAWSENAATSPLAPLLAARLAPRVPFLRALGAAFATTPLFLALPCATLALTVALRERAAPPSAGGTTAGPGSLATAARDLEEALQGASTLGPDAPLRVRAAALARKAVSLAGRSQATAAEQAASERLRAEAAELAAEFASSAPEFAPALRRVERALSSPEGGLAPPLASSATPGPGSGASGAGVEPGPGAPGAAGVASARPGDLGPAPLDPTFPVRSPASGPEAPPAGPAPTGPGTIADNPWWSPRYDVVVQAWLAERRRP